MKRIRLAQVDDDRIVDFIRIRQIGPAVLMNNLQAGNPFYQAEPELNICHPWIEFHIIHRFRPVLFEFGQHTAFCGNQKDIPCARANCAKG